MVGLLNNWLNKNKKEQLKKTGEVKVAKKEPKKAKEEATTITKETDVKKEKIKLPAESIAYKILVKPLVTEKSAVAESINKYSFVVMAGASKFQIKKAVEDVYGVKPTSVNIINVEGRRVRFGRTFGRRSDFKKAIVTLPKGKSIDIHVGV
ncbi:MAG: 50S ribosomal protein L23 [Patescibacteria group bacterium]